MNMLMMLSLTQMATAGRVRVGKTQSRGSRRSNGQKWVSLVSLRISRPKYAIITN